MLIAKTCGTKGHKANTESPYIIFFRWSIGLYSEYIRVKVSQSRKDRFTEQVVFILQPEICIVGYHKDICPLLRDLQKSSCNAISLIECQRIASRIIRKIKDNYRLAPTLTRLSYTFEQALDIVAFSSKQWIGDACCTFSFFYNEPIVWPVQVRQNYCISRLYKHIADIGYRCCKPRNDCRKRYLFTIERGILSIERFFPGLTKLRDPACRRISNCFCWSQTWQFGTQSIQHHWLAMLISHANSSIESISFFSCFGTLGDDPFRKIHSPSHFRKQPLGYSSRKDSIQFFCQLIHINLSSLNYRFVKIYF